MNDVTQVHEEKETLTVDINIPGHAHGLLQHYSQNHANI